MTKNWERFLIAAMPVGMLLLWLAIVARGDGRLDALGNPVGGDFAMFYIAGNMAWQGEWHLLYNEAEQQRRLIELFQACRWTLTCLIAIRQRWPQYSHR